MHTHKFINNSVKDWLSLIHIQYFTLVNAHFTKNIHSLWINHFPAIYHHYIWKGKISQILINLDMFCHNPCQKTSLNVLHWRKTEPSAIEFWQGADRKNGHLVEQYLCACGSVTWHQLHERWLQDGSIAGRQTEGAGTVSRTSKVTSRLIECL